MRTFRVELGVWPRRCGAEPQHLRHGQRRRFCEVGCKSRMVVTHENSAEFERSVHSVQWGRTALDLLFLCVDVVFEQGFGPHGQQLEIATPRVSIIVKSEQKDISSCAGVSIATCDADYSAQCERPRTAGGDMASRDPNLKSNP